MPKKGDYQIPFDEDGNQMHYADTSIWKAKEWRDNCKFEDCLEYMTYCRGRSATYFEFQGVDMDRKYTMFLKEFDAIVKKLDNGMLSGTWTFIKRGTNYGVKLVEPFYLTEIN